MQNFKLLDIIIENKTRSNPNILLKVVPIQRIIILTPPLFICLKLEIVFCRNLTWEKNNAKI